MPLVHHSTIDQAFQDLSQLMSKAEEMVKLAEYFKERLHQQQGAGAPEAELDAETALDLFDLGLVTPVTKESAGRQYHRELARQVGVTGFDLIRRGTAMEHDGVSS